MADEAGTTHEESAGGGPPSDEGTPSPGAEIVAPVPDGSGPLAPPTGGTPVETAQSEPEVDWAKRYSDLKPAFDTANTEKKAAEDQVKAYEERFGALQPETATAPPANQWAAPPAAPQSDNVPPHVKGVYDAIDEAFLSGNAVEGARLMREYNILGSQQQVQQAAQQGLTAEQVQQIAQTNIQQYAAKSAAISSAIAHTAGQFGPEFLNVEIEVQGVKMSREAALRHQMEQTGQTDPFNALLGIDGQGVMDALYNKSYAKAMDDIANSANADQIPSGATVFQDSPPPSSKQRAQMERDGAIFAPPKDPSKA